MKKIYLFLSFILFSASYINSHLPIGTLAGVHALIKKEYRYLSPLHGALLEESGKLLKIYNSNLDSSTVKLVKKLFHFNYNQVIPSVAQNNPVNYLRVSDIARILAWLESNSDAVSSELSQIAQELCDIAKSSYPEKVNPSSFKRHFRYLIKLIKQSFSDNYKPYITQFILLAFLYQKAIDKSDLLNYLNTINKYISILEALPESLEITQDWFFKFYQAGDYLEIEQKLRDYNISELDINLEPNFFEYIATAIIANRNYLNSFPAILPQSQFNLIDRNNVPDCVEAAIREFCNLILYNPETKKFDFSRVPHLVNISPELKEFYLEKNIDPVLIKDNNLGLIWFKYLCNKPKIEYVKNNSEMYPTIENFINIINYLFGINATNINNLCEIFSWQKLKLSCNQTVKIFFDEEVIVLEFTCLDLNSEAIKKFNINVHIAPSKTFLHCWVTVPERDNNKNIYLDPDLQDRLINQLKKYKNNLEVKLLLKLLKL